MDWGNGMEMLGRCSLEMGLVDTLVFWRRSLISLAPDDSAWVVLVVLSVTVHISVPFKKTPFRQVRDL